MARIGREIAAAPPCDRVAMVHRLGRLLIGETSVAVIVTAPHRRPAFEAALEGINRLKKTVPIWKKEHFVDGEVWVEGEWDRECSAWRAKHWLSPTCLGAAPRGAAAGPRVSRGRQPGARRRHGQEPGGRACGRPPEGRFRGVRQRRAAGDRGLRAADRTAAFGRPAGGYQRLHRQGTEVRNRFRRAVPARPALGGQSGGRRGALQLQLRSHHAAFLHPQLHDRSKPG